MVIFSCNFLIFCFNSADCLFRVSVAAADLRAAWPSVLAVVTFNSFCLMSSSESWYWESSICWTEAWFSCEEAVSFSSYWVTIALFIPISFSILVISAFVYFCIFSVLLIVKLAFFQLENLDCIVLWTLYLVTALTNALSLFSKWTTTNRYRFSRFSLSYLALWAIFLKALATLSFLRVSVVRMMLNRVVSSLVYTIWYLVIMFIVSRCSRDYLEKDHC